MDDWSFQDPLHLVHAVPLTCAPFPSSVHLRVVPSYLGPDEKSSPWVLSQSSGFKSISHHLYWARTRLCFPWDLNSPVSYGSISPCLFPLWPDFLTIRKCFTASTTAFISIKHLREEILTHTLTHVHAHMHISTHARTHTWTHACIHTHRDTHMHLNVYSRMCFDGWRCSSIGRILLA